MANNYFEFKQFRIDQEKAAMKVGTDGVLIGAWATIPDNGLILDVGTGTGLIAIMMAQRSNCHITAIDVDECAFLQASENIANCNWSNRIEIKHQDFLKWQSRKKYNLIVSNPPYFSNGVKPDHKSRTVARHNELLSIGDFIAKSKVLLASNGIISLVLTSELEKVIQELSVLHNLFISKICRIRPIPGKNYHRIMVELTNYNTVSLEEELIIETGPRHSYSDEYRKLTKAFYLNF